jgi:hypothetical protein
MPGYVIAGLVPAIQRATRSTRRLEGGTFCPVSALPKCLEQTDGWIPGTSPGMTTAA